MPKLPDLKVKLFTDGLATGLALAIPGAIRAAE
jgi:hypothetical protein